MKIHCLREIVGSAWYLAEPSLPTLFWYHTELYHEISNKNFTKEKTALASIDIPVSHDRGLPSHLASTAGHDFGSHFEHFCFFQKKCLRVRLTINMSPWVPRIWIEVWVGTYDRIRRPVNRYVLIKQRSHRSKGGRMLQGFTWVG